MKILSMAFLATFAFANFANATITPVLDSGNPVGFGPFLYTYSIDLAASEQLNGALSAPGGTYFTITISPAMCQEALQRQLPIGPQRLRSSEKRLA